MWYTSVNHRQLTNSSLTRYDLYWNLSSPLSRNFLNVQIYLTWYFTNPNRETNKYTANIYANYEHNYKKRFVSITTCYTKYFTLDITYIVVLSLLYIFSYKYIKIRRLHENYRRRTLVIVFIFHRIDRVFRFHKFKTIAYDNIRY